MHQKELEEIIQHIVSESFKLKDKYLKGIRAKVEFGDIFSKDEKEYQELAKVIEKIGKEIYLTLTGNIYSLNKPIKTIAGDLYLVKIRKPDINLKLRGDADFDTNYPKLKSQFQHHSNFELIVREKFEMLRLSDPEFNVMACFSNIPVREWIKT